VAIEGRSGSGKSTLLHILGGLDGLDDGTLEFEGADYTRRATQPEQRRIFTLIPILLAASAIASIVTPLFTIRPANAAMLASGASAVFWLAILIIWLARQYLEERPITALRNRHFGFVFQFYHLLPELSVLENTLLAAMVERSWLGYNTDRQKIYARGIEILEQVGLSHRLKHRPSQLSGGERQRVAIARALMNNPRVLFADEPTGNLDVETGRQIMNLLEKLHRDSGQTIVMVTHDRALAREADRVLVLKDGKLEKAE
jgi:ABC-type lipoprotein export system ATPase subunit